MRFARERASSQRPHVSGSARHAQAGARAPRTVLAAPNSGAPITTPKKVKNRVPAVAVKVWLQTNPRLPEPSRGEAQAPCQLTLD